jgi:phage tail sheath protein FI
MPEYLAPGVYVEEVSFRSKTIEGLSTSVTGFVGPTLYGPTEGEPELLTSFADFARIYGGLYPLKFEDASEETPNYVAHAVRAFFDNGGSKLYVTRVYQPSDSVSGKSRLEIGAQGSPPQFRGLRARFPGEAGDMRVTFAVRLSSNALASFPNPNPTSPPSTVREFRGLRPNDVVYLFTLPSSPITSPSPRGLYDVGEDGSGLYLSSGGTQKLRANDPELANVTAHLVTVIVRVLRPGRFEEEETLNEFSPHPLSRNSLSAYFMDEPESRRLALSVPFAILPPSSAAASGAALLKWLLGNANDPLAGVTADRLSSPSAFEKVYLLADGSDGDKPKAEAYKGKDTGTHKSGLETFTDIDEISIVAAPGATANYTSDTRNTINQTVQSLIIHCERMRYRVAVLDAPNNQLVSEVREFRGQFDSKYAALYYPWVKTLDPLDEDGRRELLLPPSGFVTGIYARNDAQQPGVSKAPANEVVLGAIGLEFLLNKAQQDVLNPEGVNCFRFFEGRGFRLWGARTISSDPEWKYVNVRRYFAYVEHSIDKGTQFVVFENNDDRLWANVRQTIEDFLFNEWRNGALFGAKPEEAFFVRCDRSTMTQSDLDNGRLVCLIGIAPQRPAEFVIFRIGQFTADRRS